MNENPLKDYPYEMKVGHWSSPETVKGVVSLSAEPEIGRSVRINPGEEPLEIIDIIHENGSPAQPTLILAEKQTGGLSKVAR